MLTRFDRQFAVNLRAPLFLSEAFAAQAEADAGASIVNILDQRVFKLTPHFVSYTLAKSALHSATRMLAQALAPNVRVNAVAPGPTMQSARQHAGRFRPAGGGGAARPRTEPREEIAAAVVYLAGARSVTGVTLAVDGGQHWRGRRPDHRGGDRMSSRRKCRREDVDFDSEVPVLIIGAGAAGLCAALAASEAGIEPVVVERDAVPSGSTALSAGLIPAAGTRFQRAQGIADSAPSCSPRTSRARRMARRTRNWCTPWRSGAGPTVEWLADKYAMPFEVITDFNYPGHSAHRMHGLPSRTGAELIDRLRSAVEARDIPILTGRVAETLFADEDGFIEGVEIVPGGARDHRLRRAGARLQWLWRQSRTGAAAHPRDGRCALFRASRQSGRRGAVGRGARRAAWRAERLSGARLGRDAAQHPDHLGGDHRGRLSGERAGPPLSQRGARLFGSRRAKCCASRAASRSISSMRASPASRGSSRIFATAEKAGALITAEIDR